MKKIIRLTESDLTRIVNRVLMEQNEDPYSDLYGKTVTYKNSKIGVELKGIIKKMQMIKPDRVLIIHDDLFVVSNKEKYMIKKDTYYQTDLYKSYYICNKKIFNIALVEYLQVDEFDKNKIITKEPESFEFTCDGLSDVLSQRFPCGTNFSLNNSNNIKNLS